MEDTTAVFLRAAIEPFLVMRFGRYMPEKEFEGLLIASDNDDFVPRLSPDTPPHPAWSRT